MGLMHGLPKRDDDESPQEDTARVLPGREREQQDAPREPAPQAQPQIPSQYEQMFSQPGQTSSQAGQRPAGLLGMLLSWLINRFMRRR
jgi:hypothetical protein